MARILIVAGGCRGRQLAATMVGEGHAVRVSTRTEDGRAAIEAAGAECWVGDPDRLATLRGALDGVTILCWLLGCASGPADALAALHGPRLQFFLTQAIDTTVRGFVYEARGTSPAQLLAEGERTMRALTHRNAIPAASLLADPSAVESWLAAAIDAIDALLVGS